ncbi:MAG: hypothetical protein U5L96_03250 [Owenweeksia sp.]|nr:hypothetical protein [Owenweeksia sp.]
MKKLILALGVCLWVVTSNAQLTAPTTESFDNTTTPTNWSTSATSGGPWIFSGSTNNVNCAAAPDHTGNSGNYAWMDQSGTDAGVILETPDIDVSALTTPYLEFYYWLCGVGYSPANPLYIETYDGTSWVAFDSIKSATTGWKYFGYNLTGSTHGANLVRIRFRAESGGNTNDFYGDNALDDISVLEAPTCPQPVGLLASNIGSSTADVSWNTVTAASNGYEVIYGQQGFDPATGGTSTMTMTDTVNITGLSGATDYHAYVIADCGAANGISDTASPVSFTTLCVPFTAPYSRDFETDAQDVPPLCWADYETNSGSFVEVRRLHRNSFSLCRYPGSLSLQQLRYQQ